LFATPTNGRPIFRADLFWTVGPINLTKILSGKYDDANTQTDPMLEQARRFLERGRKEGA